MDGFYFLYRNVISLSHWLKNRIFYLYLQPTNNNLKQ